MEGLKRCLRAAGMSQKQLSEILGVTESAVSGWVLGAFLPSVKQLPRIAAALGCSIDELFEGEKAGEDAGPYTEDGGRMVSAPTTNFTQEGTI